MSAVPEALWYIENNFLQDVRLGDIAEHCKISPWHLSRRFSAATGQSLTHYMRGRRLTEAAKALAAGAPDILRVALDVGYGSHEAFTRAFRDHFGVTPEMVRAGASLANLKLVEPIRMDDPSDFRLAPPRITEKRPLLIAGMLGRLRMDNPELAPLQWQRFIPYIDAIPDLARPNTSYGLVESAQGGTDFQYLCGVEVSRIDNLQPELAAIRLPAQRYAAFAHEGHLAGIRNTIHAVFTRGIHDYKLEWSGLPDFIEYYGPGFDPEAGMGDVEIWVPLKD